MDIPNGFGDLDVDAIPWNITALKIFDEHAVVFCQRVLGRSRTVRWLEFAFVTWGARR